MGISIRLDDRCYDCPCSKIVTERDVHDNVIVKCDNDLLCHYNLSYLYDRIMKEKENDPTRR